LGFLTEVAREELYPALVAVLAGNYRLERRSLLEVEVERKGSALGRFRALNDAVVAKSAPSRIIELRLLLDGRLLSRYRADGLVVATPTGSTAYSLSAGGPILEPGLPVMVLTPICPHALTLRPVVVPDTATVEVGVEAGGSDRVYLTVDGQEGMELESGDRVVVRRAPAAVTLVRTSESLSWLEGLRSKLRWGE
jgi:NAD+ kinase